MSRSRIAVIGTGYVGLSTAVAFAEKEHSVTCVDTRIEIVQAVLERNPPIHEPGLPQALHAATLDATTDLASAVRAADIVFICVGTPTQSDSAADLSQLENAARQVALAMRDLYAYQTVVVKSTVPPGTTDTLIKRVMEEASGRQVGEDDRDFGLAMVPEYLREGVALEDARSPGRVVLGVENPRAEMVLRELYVGFDAAFVVTNSRTAELAKYMSNALLATLISFGNDFANFAAILGNVEMADALEAVAHDPRWWPGRTVAGARPEILAYLRPGPGFGGSCFPKDLRAILFEAQRFGYPLSMTREALRTNDVQAGFVIRSLERVFPEGLRGKRFGIYGLSFKPGTDDVRESPAARVIAALNEAGSVVRAFDPVAIHNYQEAYPEQTGLAFTSDPLDLFAQTDGVILVTPWDPHLSMFYDVASYRPLRHALVFDARGALAAERMRDMPCLYLSPLHPFPQTQAQ